MSRIEHLEGPASVPGERRGWSPTEKMILAFVLVLLALSPAILGIYWEMLLPNG